MIVAIVQASTLVSDDDAQKAVAAIQQQVDLHFAPLWGARADLVFVPKNSVPPAGSWVIELADVCDEPNADGYHGFDEKPSGAVGVKNSIDDGVAWSATLSHEVLELIVDPWATICMEVGDAAYSLEICDPVEGQPYAIDGVAVEDFVLPAYYRKDSKGPWNYNPDNPLPAPLTLGPGGYNNMASLGKWTQENAAKVRSSKRVPARRSRRGRRRARRR
jgi:hypothetical protein